MQRDQGHVARLQCCEVLIVGQAAQELHVGQRTSRHPNLFSPCTVSGEYESPIPSVTATPRTLEDHVHVLRVAHQSCIENHKFIANLQMLSEGRSPISQVAVMQIYEVIDERNMPGGQPRVFLQNLQRRGGSGYDSSRI